MNENKHTFEKLIQYTHKVESSNETLSETIEYALFEVDQLQKSLLAEQYIHSITMESRDRLLKFAKDHKHWSQYQVEKYNKLIEDIESIKKEFDHEIYE